MELRKPSVLLVDDEPHILKTMGISFEALGCAVHAFSDPQEALQAVAPDRFDLAFVDLKMEPIDGLAVLEHIRRKAPEVTVIVMSAHGAIDAAMEAVRKGAFYYLEKPFDLKQLRLFLDKAVERNRLEREVRSLRQQLQQVTAFGSVVARAREMLDVLNAAVHAADSQVGILLEGEPGTGKDLIAQLIHQKSPRAAKPFVPLRCAGESADENVTLFFEEAVPAGGTLYLDNPASLPEKRQEQLVRALENGLDFRLVASSSQSIDEALREGSLRTDLYRLLATVRLRIPPLAERPDDIPLLIQHFVLKHRGKVGTPFTAEAMRALKAYHWPGNVRELENVVRRALLLAGDGRVEFEHLDERVRSALEPQTQELSLAEVEKRHILRVLQHASSSDEAARILGIDTATLWRKRKRFGIA